MKSLALFQVSSTRLRIRGGGAGRRIGPGGPPPAASDQEESVRLTCHLHFGRTLYREGTIMPLSRIPKNLRGFVTADLSEPQAVAPHSVAVEDDRRKRNTPRGGRLACARYYGPGRRFVGRAATFAHCQPNFTRIREGMAVLSARRASGDRPCCLRTDVPPTPKSPKGVRASVKSPIWAEP